MINLRITTLICLSLMTVTAVAAQDFPLDLEIPPTAADSYSDAVPIPEHVIGHRIGNQHTIPSQVVDYFEAVAAVSDRVILRDHGRTHEGRRLIHAIVTSPENHANLEAIRAANLRLSDNPEDVTDSEYAEGKVILYMGYSVHGNEASGTEAAILTLYQLDAGVGSSIDNILDNSVIIIDPMLNPDGRDRFTDWVNRNRGARHTTDGQDREHNEPWPGGRTNHYWFDLNRDWLPAVHPESQGRLEIFHSWRPQVHTDFHEMGGNATYFFQPGIPSRTHHLTPAENQTLTAEIAEYHAAALESIGSLYYSEESFDDFYYGKASAYPDANGSIGILFEQASSRALESETQRGNLHYAATARNQFMTSLSTIEASLAMREKLLRFHSWYYASAAEFADDIGVDGYVVDFAGAETRAAHFAELMSHHRIEMTQLTRDVTIDGHLFSAGSSMVFDASQRQARLLRSIMETPTSFTDSLFYDVSTWNMPHAFNLPFKEYRGSVGSISGSAITPGLFETGTVIGSSDYAYVMPWSGYYAPRAAHELTEAGYQLRILKEPMAILVAGEIAEIQRGSVLIHLESNSDAIDHVETMERTARHNNVTIYGVDGGLTPTGPDLGTGTSAVIPETSIAIITGDGTSAYSAGEVWHLLASRMNLPVSLVDSDRLEFVDLDRYNVLIYAGGTTGTTVPPEPIEDFVRNGGTLITLGSGTDWAVSRELVDLESYSLDVDSLVADYAYADLSRARGSKRLAGATIMSGLDTTHPVAYGLSDNLPVFRTRSTLYDPPETPGATVGIYTENPILSGYVPRELKDQLTGKMVIGTARIGGGQMIMFADNPTFRGFWYGTNMALMNAIFLHRAI